MSLRLRLLLAVGAVALTALAIADVVTYQELRSFLYNRIDQSMEQSHIAIEGSPSEAVHRDRAAEAHSHPPTGKAAHPRASSRTRPRRRAPADRHRQARVLVSPD